MGRRPIRLSIDVSPVTDPHHQNDQAIIFDLINDPIIANPHSIKPLLTTKQLAARRSWIIGQLKDLGIHTAERVSGKRLEIPLCG